MSRPTQLFIDSAALLHNVNRIKYYAPGKKIIAMIKANAYGCGLRAVVPVLHNQVDAFGVACLEEAIMVRKLGSKMPCIIFQGIYNAEELVLIIKNQCACVIHTVEQLQWILNTPLPQPIKVWIKINTGMHRLGFQPEQLPSILQALQQCIWIDKAYGLMTHLACSDEPNNPATEAQLAIFDSLDKTAFAEISVVNSAGILYFPEALYDVVRPGIMLYGVSPTVTLTGNDFDLLPVMHFQSALIAIHHYPPNVPVGYGGCWQSTESSIIGIVPAGYGDGYPRHVNNNAYVIINGYQAPIAGRISMDMMAVDLTRIPQVNVGDMVELWGANLPVERVAEWAGTIGYELMCQTSERVRGNIAG